MSSVARSGNECAETEDECTKDLDCTLIGGQPTNVCTLTVTMANGLVVVLDYNSSVLLRGEVQ